MLQALSGPTACWAGLLRVPCWAGLLCVPCWAGLLCVPVGGGPPASRPRREPSARRVVSKPGQAPPPPTGTAARPSGPSGTLHTGGASVRTLCVHNATCPGLVPLRPPLPSRDMTASLLIGRA